MSFKVYVNGSHAGHQHSHHSMSTTDSRAASTSETPYIYPDVIHKSPSDSILRSPIGPSIFSNDSSHDELETDAFLDKYYGEAKLHTAKWDVDVEYVQKRIASLHLRTKLSLVQRRLKNPQDRVLPNASSYVNCGKLQEMVKEGKGEMMVYSSKGNECSCPCE
jgi:hypothetical protein